MRVRALRTAIDKSLESITTARSRFQLVVDLPNSEVDRHRPAVMRRLDAVGEGGSHAEDLRLERPETRVRAD
jgi:hypothetical protein